MREGHFERRTDGSSDKKVGVIYKDLTVKGVGSSTTFVRTLPDAILGTFGPDLFKIIRRFVPALARRTGETRTLINGFTGCVRDGEMMLVLGRPGSGCSTFLKAISNNRETFAEVTGDVSYGGIPANKQKDMYRGEVVYNQEDDIHFASLNVWQTFIFALMNKTKKKEQGDVPVIAEALMKMFGIEHTKYTLVSGFLFIVGREANRLPGRGRVYSRCVWRRTKACLDRGDTRLEEHRGRLGQLHARTGRIDRVGLCTLSTSHD